MNYSRPYAARSSPSSAAHKTTAVITLFALLAICGPSQRIARGAAQTQTSETPRREAQASLQKPPAGEDQAQMAQPRRRLTGERDDHSAPAGGSAQTARCEPVLTLADLERTA